MWYYQLNNQQHGPVGADAMMDLLARGTLTRETQVWRDGMARWLPLLQTELTPPTQPAPRSNYTSNAMRRYTDAYSVARATTGIGVAVKILSVILGGIIACAGLIVGQQNFGNLIFVIGGLILGAVVAIPIFVLGVLVSAQGQHLKATLDEAVHTSPFLTDEQRASVMSL